MSSKPFVSQIASMPHHMPGRSVTAKAMVSPEFPDRLFLLLNIEGNQSAPIEVEFSDILCIAQPDENEIFLYARQAGEFRLIFRQPEWAREAAAHCRMALSNVGVCPFESMEAYTASLSPEELSAFESQRQRNEALRQQNMVQDAAMRRKSSLRIAAIGYLITAGLILYGLVSYARGKQMQWFGLVLDVPWKFLLLMAFLAAAATWALIRGLKNQ